MATKVQIQKTIAVLVAAYPNTDAKEQHAMEPFLKMVEQMLAPYPPAVLDELISPRSGIIGISRFFPSIAEIKQFCDRAWDKIDPPNRSAIDRAPLQLSGPPEDAAASKAHKARMMQKFQDLISELASAPDPWEGHGALRARSDAIKKNKTKMIIKTEAQKEVERQQAEVWLEQQAVKAKTERPPALSAEALKAYFNPVSGGEQ